MRLLAKPYLAHVKDPAHARTSFERTARFFFKTPPYSLFLPDQYRCDGQSRSALWVSSGRRATRRRVILYLHGGGYLAGSPHTHRAMTARLSRLTGLAVFAPSYRLAPEHPYPAALNDASAGFAALEARATITAISSSEATVPAVVWHWRFCHGFAGPGSRRGRPSSFHRGPT